MKKITFILLFLVSCVTHAQLFTIESCSNLDTSTYGPMYSIATAKATNRTAVIYPASQLQNITEAELTAAYFRRAGTSPMVGDPSFKIYLKEVTNSDWGSGSLNWDTAIDGAVLVYDADPSAAVGNTAGWKNFQFSSTFTYSGQQNLAVFFEYSNPTAGNGVTWYYEYTSPCINTSNNNTTKYTNNTTGVFPAALGSSDYRRPLIGFDFVVSCPAPTSLTANVTAHSAALSWTAGGTETSWEYAVLPATDPIPTSGNATTSSEVTAVLSPATSYKAYVRAVCGGEDGDSMWTVISFTSPCAPIATLPWLEGFEGLTTLSTTSFPACWTKENGDWSTSNATTYNTARNGTNYLRDYYNATNEYMWTPGFELEAGVSYDFTTHVQGDNHTGWVVDMFYNTQAASAGATQLGASYNVPGTGSTQIRTYEEMRRTFVPAESGVYYFAVRVNSSNTSAWYVAFDDFSLEESPLCDAPTDVQFSEVTAFAAEMSWTSVAGVTYNIQYGVGNYQVGQGTIVNNVTSPFEFETLDPATNYVVYLQSVCEAGPGSWSGPYAFTTACAPIATLPWHEGFEDMTNVGTNMFPICWTKENGDWSTTNATTYNTPRTGTKYLRDYYQATNEYMWTPGFELEEGVSYDFITHVQGDNHTGWVVDMFYNTQADSEGATQVGTSYNVPGTGSTAIGTYEEMRRTFVPETSGVYYFAVRVNSSNSSAWYLAFDDFALELSPTCPSPDGVTFTSVISDSVTFTVQANATASDFDVEYGPQGFVPGQGILISDVSNPVTIGELMGNTEYEVYVRANCEDEESVWKGPYSFVTPCTAFAVPTVVEGFEQAGSLPECWSVTTVSGSTSWAQTTPTGAGDIPNAHAGTRAMTKVYTNSDALLFTPPLDYSAIGEPTRINTWLYRHHSAANNDRYRFYVNTSASLTGATEIGQIFLKTTLAPVVSERGWYQYTIDIPETMHGEPIVYVIIRGTTENGSSSYTLGIDEFGIEMAPELSTPALGASAFKAYPNPVTDVLNFETARNITSVRVHSLLGQQVIELTSASITSVDLSGLSAGTYFVNVSDGQLTETIKVIKK